MKHADVCFFPCTRLWQGLSLFQLTKMSLNGSSRARRESTRSDLPPNPPEPPMTVIRALPSREPMTPEDERHSGSRGLSEAEADVAPRKYKGWRRLSWIGSGMRHDIRARAPYYLSDWTDAWNYRVVPASWVSHSIQLGVRRAYRSISSSRTCYPDWRSRWILS